MLKYYNYDIVFQEIPNEVSLAINITNCPNRCKGCHSPHLQKDIGDVLDEDCIVSIMDKYASAITCFCFMGGDNSPHRVAELAKFIQSQYPKIKTAWYSGCPNLPKNFNKNSFQFIKLGSYKVESGSLDSQTSNQRLFEIQHDGFMKDISYMFKTKKQRGVF
ncbi:anaerobic ribonucleoside-triphosphate reductase activating protein [Marinifilum sp. D714]|uniref:anaerobic ribonucleoside-triphosphate reductase activating protein n=1 Tax=Marinifilum sp. D714 TaxID=2937523 RepID=UPI0027BE5E6E|nr:anaerobic ribonucleoside-triphosphate reductase activating protein [Marinifilum sp. D714]MDQ2178993.1 anaerobic ribonucleoside-triphosphate reductase activating protein [Marinifilum sp. D714]